MSEEKTPRKKKLTVQIYKENTGATPSKELMERHKRNNTIKREILKALKKGPKTVPEISNDTGIPTYEVMWFIATFLRYRMVEPVEKTDDDYWKYKLIK